MTVQIGSAGTGHLEVEFSSNSASEALYLDNIVFTSSVAMVADDDDDNDGWSDGDEADCGTDPLDANDVPSDSDGNGICDALEGDVNRSCPGHCLGSCCVRCCSHAFG